VLVGVADCPFYKHKEMTTKLKDVKAHFATTFRTVFDALDQYVITPENLLEREKNEFENTRTLLREF
jgi:hypothetical protein